MVNLKKLTTLAWNNAYVENFLEKKNDFPKIIFANQTSIELGIVIAEKNRPQNITDPTFNGHVNPRI